MSTTLEGARKALLKLDRIKDFLGSWDRAYFANEVSLIADYLDNQVPLTVENEQLRAKLAHAESFMNTTNALPSQIPTFMEDRQKIGRASRGGIYGKSGPSRSDTLYREGRPLFAVKIAKDSSLGKAITEKSANGTVAVDLMQLMRDQKINLSQEFGKFGGTTPAGPQVTATSEEILKTCDEITQAAMRATEALGKLPALHWYLKADCNCNTCVKERGYLV